MKQKLILSTLICILTSTIVSAQIPNSNFEKWTKGANHAPDGWRDNGSKTSGFYPASQSTDFYQGKFAVKVETKISGSDTTKGMVRTERPDSNEEGFGPAFPISKRVQNLKGYYKYSPKNGDSAQIIAFITKTGYKNTQWGGSLLAWGSKQLPAASTYTPFSIGYENYSSSFIYWDSTKVPDSAFIELLSYKGIGSKGSLPPLGNSVLYVDALNFDSYLTDANEHMLTPDFKLFPTNSNGDIDVVFSTLESKYTNINIYDLDGKEICSLLSKNLPSGRHTFHYNLKALNSGSYLFMISTERGYRVEKFFIN